jgi:DNA repair protein RadC
MTARSRRPTIREWPEDDRPREKLLRLGPGALSDAELLALLLRSGHGNGTALDLARDLLSHVRGVADLRMANPSELMRTRGVGPAKAAEITAAFELGRRAGAGRSSDHPVLRSPEDVARLVIPSMRDLRQEIFRVLVLDSHNGVRGNVELSRGILNASLVHPREVFKVAIDLTAAAVIVVHNHPSGNPEPSSEDVAMTRQLAEAGRIVGIPVHDHVIIAGEKFTSLAERGLLSVPGEAG